MDEEAVKKAVEEYLEAPDQYALMITGEWGCGKTHFVEHALKDHVESLDKPYSLIRVSAYGTRTPDDLYDAIALGIVRGRAVGSDGKNAVVGLLQDAGISFLGKTMKQIKKKTGLEYEASPKMLAELLLGSSTLLVLDDLERCKIDVEELFGIVDALVTRINRKVVLVCNEDGLESEIKDSPKYTNLSEKTVWRKCLYAPSTSSIVGQLLQDEDGLPEGAREALLGALEKGGHRSINFRSVKKLRPLLRSLGQTDFFKGDTDRATKKLVLKDVCKYSISASVGDASQEIEESEGSTNIFGEPSENKRRRHEAPDFIGAYFERYEGLDADQIDGELKSYREAYYPEGGKARAASDLLSSWNLLFVRNDEVPEIIDTLLGSILPEDGSPGISFKRYREILKAAKEIHEYHPKLLESLDPFLERMKEAISLSPDKAVAAISNDPLSWQDRTRGAAPFPEEPFLDEVDELREWAFDIALENDVLLINRALREDPDSLPKSLLNCLERQKGDAQRAVWLLEQIDPEELAAIMPAISPESLYTLHRVFSPTTSSGSLLKKQVAKENDQSKFPDWLAGLRREIGKIETDEVAARKWIGYIESDLDQIAASEQSASESEGPS